MTFFKVDQISLAFGGIRAVDQVSFELGPNSIFAIIGPNGAGKTSVFNLISRIYDPHGGSITFQDADITTVSPHRVCGMGLARTFQNIELFDHATVLDNLLLGRHSHRTTNVLQEALFLPAVRRSEVAHRRRVEEIIDFLDLAAHRHSRILNLSYGVRKVVELARALCAEPKLILLDEPASGLNTEETEDMAFWIQDIRDKLGIAVLMVEHDMGLVSRVAERVLALNQGMMLAEGTPAEVLAHPDVIKAYLGA